jgi:uncharacterized membrane protein YccC
LFLTINARTRFTRSIPQSSWPLIAGGGFILVVPYFLGDSNDYRLIGLVLPLAGILIWLATSLGSKFLWLPVVLIVVTMLTGSSMIANEYGFIIPKNILIIGDGALAGVIGFIIAIWISAWLPRSRTRRVLSHEITEGSKSH